MRPPRPLITLLAALLLALGAAACGGDDEAPTQGGQPDPAQQSGGEESEQTGSGGAPATGSIEVVMRDIKFVPARATVRVGQEVVWRNEDPVAHTVTAEKGADFDSGNVDPKQEFRFRPEKPGRIHYVCRIHPGHEGDLVVDES